MSPFVVTWIVYFVSALAYYLAIRRRYGEQQANTYLGILATVSVGVGVLVLLWAYLSTIL